MVVDDGSIVFQHRDMEVSLKKGECAVRLSGASPEGRIEADALRLESARRLNDGSLVTKITLMPEDGIILLDP